MQDVACRTGNTRKFGKKGLVHRAQHVEEQLDILNVYTLDCLMLT